HLSPDVGRRHALRGAGTEQRRRTPRPRRRRGRVGAGLAGRRAVPGRLSAMMPAARTRLLQVAPALAIIGVFMLAPLCLMAYVSFLQKGINGGVIWDQYTAQAYVNYIFERDLDDNLVINTDYLQIFARSFGLSLLTAVLALAIGFPTALYMAMQPENRRN